MHDVTPKNLSSASQTATNYCIVCRTVQKPTYLPPTRLTGHDGGGFLFSASVRSVEPPWSADELLAAMISRMAAPIQRLSSDVVALGLKLRLPSTEEVTDPLSGVLFEVVLDSCFRVGSIWKTTLERALVMVKL